MSSESTAEPAVRVGIGLIRRGGSFLVRQRPDGAALAGFWEFPGGKCERGEAADRAAVRECVEETGLAVRTVALRQTVEHLYPHARVELYYYDCEPVDPVADPDPATGFRWVDASALAALTFPEANGPVVAELVREFAIQAESG